MKKPLCAIPSRFPFFAVLLMSLFIASCVTTSTKNAGNQSIDPIIAKMTLIEKIGQLQQIDLSMAATPEQIPEGVKQAIREGKVGSALNVSSQDIANAVQKIAVEESPSGVPLLIARDVIHGFKTIMPIPLGQAASWNSDLVEQGARVAAVEASAEGIRWTFAPMLDISRDARWGRIAESFGEDPYLTSVLAEASVRGYQGDSLSDPESIAACAKHFIGYGAAEGGRDYNTAFIPDPLLHDVYLPPFQAAIDAGSATIMSSFNDVNGVPASTNHYLLYDVLRQKLGFDGVLVSDWNSILETIAHGHAGSEKHAAEMAANAELDMEMVSQTYQKSLAALIDEGRFSEKKLNIMVNRIIRLKRELNLFDQPYTDSQRRQNILTDTNKAVAKAAAIESLVLLKNKKSLLPLNKTHKIALVGPLTDAGHDQMGTWSLDGNKENSVTVLDAFNAEKKALSFSYTDALTYSRDRNTEKFNAAIQAAKKSDVVVFIGGEEASISGEAQSRADIRLPGAQEVLIRELKKTGKPIVLVIMAGRPIALNDIIDDVDAIVMAWHPGTMGGEAVRDILLGRAEPVGRLPISWPKVSGQAPLYYNHTNTGRPALAERFVQMDDYPIEAPQHSTGHASFYIDAGFTPQFPFGYGLSYSNVEYKNFAQSANTVKMDGELKFSVDITNTGSRPIVELAQLYIQDVTASVVQPIRVLKDFKRVSLAPGETQTVAFSLPASALAFHNVKLEKVVEPGLFNVWIAANAESGLKGSFTLEK